MGGAPYTIEEIAEILSEIDLDDDQKEAIVGICQGKPTFYKVSFLSIGLMRDVTETQDEEPVTAGCHV